ncbi:vesicular glutamate transporter [Trichuris trichiura]|uniref:Sialin n=1 Tax=Trichuris trichiura TaxID=36087 RepID=A0A077ZBU0_TRITR|nr:vesicular glutamate transporter [Trichuris trichiura]
MVNSRECSESTSLKEKRPMATWKFARRYYLTLIAFMGFCILYAMRVNLSIAILYMTTNTSRQDALAKDVAWRGGECSDWNSVTVGAVLGSFFYGYLVTQLPSGWLACKVGGRRLLGFGIGICGALALLTFSAARSSPYALIALRVVQGLSQARIAFTKLPPTYPSMQALWSQWAPEKERAKLSAIVYSGSYFGTVIAIPVSALIAEHSHWSVVFYVSGLFGILWSLLWMLTVADSPSKDKKITQEELALIRENRPAEYNRRKTTSVPWKRILLSIPVWAIVVAHFAENWGFYTMLTYLPAYMNDVLHFELQKTGFVSAIPYLTMGILLQVSGILAHCIQKKFQLRLVILRKLMTSGGLLVQAAFVLLTVSTSNSLLATAYVCVGVGFGGIAWSGFSTNQLDVADQASSKKFTFIPKYASVVMGISNTIATLPGMISPLLVGAIVKEKTISEWRIIFYITTGMFAAGALLYMSFAQATKQSWTKPEAEDHTLEEQLASSHTDSLTPQ